jgi:CheY-like chemotaxis protein
VVLSVTDTGEGMDAATAERIFEPFFTCKKTGGTGLGLSTVYGIVEQSGGNIAVESTLNKGTTFRIVLPVVHEARCRELDLAREKPFEVRKLRATVLLVEDEEPLRRCLANSLRAIGCYVLQAEDGQRALELARKQLLLIDVVISDIVMPRLGGVDLARELRCMRSNLPVILMSGYADVTPSRDELRSGKTIFIQKPFTPDVMKDLIQSVLQQRAPSPPDLLFTGAVPAKSGVV